MEHLIAFLKRHHRPLIHCALVLAILATTIITQSIGIHYALKKASEWTNGLSPSPAESILLTTPAVQFTEAERIRLDNQFKLAKRREEIHLKVASSFMVNYYMSTLIVFVVGVIAAVPILFIAKEGWPSLSPYIKTTFVTATIVVTFFGAFPSLFQQTQNIDSNVQTYCEYIALENEILTYAATGSATASNHENKKIPVDDFLIYVDRTLRALNKMSVQIDPSKMPIYKFDAAR